MSRLLLLSIVLSCASPLALAAESPASPSAEKARAIVDRGLKFLVARQKPDGSVQSDPREPPALTALVLKALVQSPTYGPDSEPARKATAYLFSMQQEDGGIYRDSIANYNTAIAISALSGVNDAAKAERIGRAVAFLKKSQWSEDIAGANGKKVAPTDPQYGGWTYGGTQRGGADLSNTALVLDALKDAGLAPNDPTFARALTFVTKLQNNSETNPADWAGDDGGFIYNTGRSGEGSSSAGEYTSPDGKRRVRSYGSMTYAGLKSMLYAGLSKDDPRVKSAWKWVSDHWSLREHPGMSEANPAAARDGIFYYYHTLARALRAYGEPTVVDRKGERHDWRAELIDTLAAEQNSDGSFAGTRAWMENNATIATAMAVLAVQEVQVDVESKR